MSRSAVSPMVDSGCENISQHSVDRGRASARNGPGLTLQVPSPPPMIFPTGSAPVSAGLSSPVSPSRHRKIRFSSRVRVGSLRHKGDTRADATDRRQSSEPTSPAAYMGADTGSDSDSDSSFTVPLHDSRTHLNILSPLPASAPTQSFPDTPAAPEVRENEQTYLLMGPSYAWSEHTPLLPKRPLPPAPRGRGTRRYSSDPGLNSAALARAQAAAKRTEEDVHYEHFANPYRSLQWWWWKLRQECCCCVLSDDDEDEMYD